MPSLKDIRKRISSVKNTQKITRAMKLVSTAKLKRAQSAMSELRPYAAKYRELLGSLVAQVGEAAHPLMESRAKVRRVGVFALTSDRGMCGAFNAQIQKAVVRLAAERDAELVLYPLGRRVNKFARKSEFAVGEAFGEITPATSTESVRRISDALVGAFMAGEIDEAVVIFNEFQSAISQVPVVRQLLPVAAETADEGLDDLADLIYEPDQSSLLAYVVPRYVEVQVRQAILESIAGEHAARMNAMNSATDNASDMIRSLTLQANRARQAAITKELMEIIGGAEAL